MSGADRGAAAVSGAASAPFATFWGQGIVVVADGRLVEVRLPWSGRVSGAGSVAGEQPGAGDDAGMTAVGPSGTPAGARDVCPSEGDRQAAAHWAQQLGAYFGGRLAQWTAEEVGVDDWDVTEFRRAVYRALLDRASRRDRLVRRAGTHGGRAPGRARGRQCHGRQPGADRRPLPPCGQGRRVAGSLR